MTNACLPRSAAQLEEWIDELNPAGNPDFQRRDITGDNIPETFCNKFVQAFCRKADVALPELLANDTIDWLDSGPGRAAGWLECTFDFAKRAAGRGEIVLPTYFNKSGPGHISVLRDAKGNHAQAGRTNTNKGSILSGFGSVHVRYFHHL